MNNKLLYKLKAKFKRFVEFQIKRNREVTRKAKYASYLDFLRVYRLAPIKNIPKSSNNTFPQINPFPYSVNRP